MKNDSNIYDIDGNIIRNAGDNHKMTIEEAKKRIDFYTKKLENIDKNDKNISIYNTYIRNLNRYILELYSKMSTEELTAAINNESVKNTTEEEVKKAIEELKNEVDNDENEPEQDKVKTQDDFIVNRDNEPNTIMDEYVDFEEV